MFRIRAETALEVLKKKEIESSYSWKEKRKQYSFFQAIETSIHFLGMKQNSISQAISNDKCVKKKNKHF